MQALVVEWGEEIDRLIQSAWALVLMAEIYDDRHRSKFYGLAEPNILAALSDFESSRRNWMVESVLLLLQRI